MPTPKRKLSRSRRDMRNANKGIQAQSFSLCSNDACSEPKLPHEVCGSCGFYRGKKVIATKADRTVKRTQAEAKKRAQKAKPRVEGEQN